MPNLNYLLNVCKTDLINLIIIQTTIECGVFDEEDLRKRLNKERRFILLYLVLQSIIENNSICKVIKVHLNYTI